MVIIPANYNLIRLRQIMVELEIITAAVVDGQLMPTPETIESLLKYAEQMKIQAEAAGFEFEGGK